MYVEDKQPCRQLRCWILECNKMIRWKLLNYMIVNWHDCSFIPSQRTTSIQLTFLRKIWLLMRKFLNRRTFLSWMSLPRHPPTPNCNLHFTTAISIFSYQFAVSWQSGVTWSDEWLLQLIILVVVGSLQFPPGRNEPSNYDVPFVKQKRASQMEVWLFVFAER